MLFWTPAFAGVTVSVDLGIEVAPAATRKHQPTRVNADHVNDKSSGHSTKLPRCHTRNPYPHRQLPVGPVECAVDNLFIHPDTRNW
jgi:hypothetical protein